MTPVKAGVIACRLLGCDVQAFDESGSPVVGQTGELVIRRPMPSMPVGFWGDDDGSRYRAAYFEDFPGVWRHGDWITIHDDGSCVITGRSDATLNRGGVRLGTSEFYAVVESIDGVADSLVVHLEDDEGGMGELLLFVAPSRAARWMTTWSRPCAPPCAPTCHPATCPTRSCRSAQCRGPCPARNWRCRSRRS
jgi:acetoacetyl-CoA synthetase